MTQDSNSRMELRSRCSPEERESRIRLAERALRKFISRRRDLHAVCADQALTEIMDELRLTASALDEAKADSARFAAIKAQAAANEFGIQIYPPSLQGRGFDKYWRCCSADHDGQGDTFEEMIDGFRLRSESAQKLTAPSALPDSATEPRNMEGEELVETFFKALGMPEATIEDHDDNGSGDGTLTIHFPSSNQFADAAIAFLESRPFSASEASAVPSRPSPAPSGDTT